MDLNVIIICNIVMNLLMFLNSCHCLLLENTIRILQNTENTSLYQYFWRACLTWILFIILMHSVYSVWISNIACLFISSTCVAVKSNIALVIMIVPLTNMNICNTQKALRLSIQCSWWDMFITSRTVYLMRLHLRHSSPIMGYVNDYVAHIYRNGSCPMQLIQVRRLQRIMTQKWWVCVNFIRIYSSEIDW